jgi:transposase
VRQEWLPWLSNSRRATKRFAQTIGRECREMTISRVAEMHQMTWDQVRALEMEYMEELVKQNPIPQKLEAIGVDEISIRKGHNYAIVVADLEKQRPIWMSKDLGRDEEHMDRFFEEMGKKRSAGIKLAVMDMWKPFRNSLRTNARQAEIVYDKFHVIKHLSSALDNVRRLEYKRVAEKDKRFIKGQRYTLLSHKANLDTDGRQALRLLLKANKRLNKAYLLKESFGQLWDYNNPTWARKFFDSWKSQLRWSRMKPFDDFVGLVERHWDGIISYCKPDHKVSLGFMEGLNNKIRVIQRRAFGIRDMDYLRLKVVTSFLQER